MLSKGFLCGSDSKASAYTAGDLGSTPGSGISSGEGNGNPLQYSWSSLVAQVVKNLPTMQETWVRPLGQEDSLEKEMTTQNACLENSVDRGAWKATVHGVAKNWT